MINKKFLVLLAVPAVLAVALLFIMKDSCGSGIEERYSFMKHSRYEAVVKSMDCGATTSTKSAVYLLKKNDEISWWDKPVLVADKLEEFSLRWESEACLTFNFKKARIHEFKNFWYFFEEADPVRLKLEERE